MKNEGCGNERCGPNGACGTHCFCGANGWCTKNEQCGTERCGANGACGAQCFCGVNGWCMNNDKCHNEKCGPHGDCGTACYCDNSGWCKQAKRFISDSIRFFNKCEKPDAKEFKKIATATGVGFLIMGFIGYFIKLIHIPIHNIIIGSG